MALHLVVIPSVSDFTLASEARIHSHPVAVKHKVHVDGVLELWS